MPRPGVIVTEREHGRTKELFYHFLNEYMAPKHVFFGKPGSKPFVTQMAYAKKMIADSALYLGYSSRFDLDPTDFAIRCIDFLFKDRSWANYAIKVDTMCMCNGKVFWSIAPKVLNEIEQNKKQADVQAMHSENINNQIEVMTLG